MTTIKVDIHVEDIGAVISQYDRIKVYRSSTETGTFDEITDDSTMIVLVGGQSDYEYIDSDVPNSIYWYKTSYYNTSTLLESVLSDAFQATDAGLYVTLQEIRDEDIDEDDLSDDRARFLLKGWQDWIDRRTGMWFLPKYMDFYVDGNGSRVLWLPIPVITLEELYINEDTTVLDSSYYTVYNSRDIINDDRKNPRIKLKRSSGSIFQGIAHNSTFEAGDRNQRLVGYFGYTESDDSVPFLIKRAIMILVNVTKENMSDGQIDELRGGRMVEEVTDRHRMKFANLWDDIGAWSVTGITEVDEALKIYRKPAFIGMARTFRWM